MGEAATAFIVGQLPLQAVSAAGVPSLHPSNILTPTFSEDSALSHAEEDEAIRNEYSQCPELRTCPCTSGFSYSCLAPGAEERTVRTAEGQPRH